MRQTKRLYLRVSPAQVSLMQAAARRLEMTVSEFVRNASLSAAVDALNVGTQTGQGNEAVHPAVADSA